MNYYRILTLTIIVGSTLKAAEGPRLGDEFMFTNPTGTLKNAYTSSQGFGITIFSEWELGKGHGLRWDIIGYTRYPDTTVMSNGQALQSTLSSMSSSLNYTYHLGRHPLGPYLLAGLGLTSYSGRVKMTGANPPQRVEGPTVPAYSQYLASTSWQPAWLVGSGYDFNKMVGITVRYHAIQSMGHTLGTIETGFSYRY